MKKKIVLSGGGTKGIAHIGALCYMDDNNLLANILLVIS
jgi:predicted acylesterase/phospholipase RssA